MSKYTKVIAALGIAAGLSVASLPAAGVFAAPVETEGTAIPAGQENAGKLRAADDVEIKVEVGEKLSLTLDADAVSAIGSDKIIAGGSVNTLSTKATVLTNAAAGYDLVFSTDGELNHSARSSHSDDAQYQIAYADTITDGGWKAFIAGDPSDTAIAKADIGGKTILTSTKASAAEGDEVTVKYNITASSNQAAGVYTGTVTYTATAK